MYQTGNHENKIFVPEILFYVAGFVPKWQCQKFREASWRGIKILTQQQERGNERVILEMLPVQTPFVVLSWIAVKMVALCNL